MKKEINKQVALYFKYPSLRILKPMSPKERVTYIAEKLQHDYKTVASKLAGHTLELIGTRKKPRGVKLMADQKIINSILKLKFIDKQLSNGLTATKTPKKKVTNEEPYYCFRVIFQIQIEGKTKGLQTYDERYILVKADTWEKAEAKVLKASKDREEPYLNSSGEMVRWKFESIEESYHTFIGSKDDFDNPVEVFSKLKTRRLKKENVWRGE